MMPLNADQMKCRVRGVPYMHTHTISLHFITLTLTLSLHTYTIYAYDCLYDCIWCICNFTKLYMYIQLYTCRLCMSTNIDYLRVSASNWSSTLCLWAWVLAELGPWSTAPFAFSPARSPGSFVCQRAPTVSGWNRMSNFTQSPVNKETKHEECGQSADAASPGPFCESDALALATIHCTTFQDFSKKLFFLWWEGNGFPLVRDNWNKCQTLVR